MSSIKESASGIRLDRTIRARREQLDLSLEELAQRSGVSRAMLSDVERGRKSPTIHLLCRIAAGLSCTVSELLQEERPRRLHVLRADARPTVRDDNGVERQVLSTALMHHGLEAIWYVVPPGESAGPFPPEALGLVEHITVVQGRLCLDHGSDSILLSAGDSVTYHIDETVSYRNPGRSTCRLFLLIDKSHLKRGKAHV